MEKKIIAALCVLVLLTATLAACGKQKGLMIEAGNGIEYPAATDEEGNAVLNDSGKVAVYVTDTNGRYVKGENGEKQTNWVDAPSKIVVNNYVETEDYKLIMPAGWEYQSNSNSFIMNDETPDTIFTFDMMQTLEADKTIQDYFADVPSNDVVVDALKQQYKTADAKETNTKVKGMDAVSIIFTAGDGVNNQYYCELLYLVQNGKVYKGLYQYVDGKSVEGFDLTSVIENNVTLK